MKKITLVLTMFCACVAMCHAQENLKLPLPDAGNVTLTLDEYNKLVELAAKKPKIEQTPLPFVIKRADVTLQVQSDSIRGIMNLQGEVFRKGISKVSLANGMTVLDVRQSGKVLPLTRENGAHVALLSGPAEFSLAVDTGLPLKIEAGRASFTFPTPSAGSVQLSLVLPGDHTFASVNAGLITNRKSENGHTTVDATLIPGQPATFWWATQEVIVPVVPREVRFLSETKTLVTVNETEMRIAVLADISIIQGEPSQFQFEVPSGYEVSGVTGATLDSTEIQSGTMTLKVNSPSLRTHEFLISMERSMNDDHADMPFLSFRGAQRETGEVLVEGAGTTEISSKEGGGLKRMDVKETNAYLRSLAHFPPQAAFRYHRQPDQVPTLSLNWVRFPDGSVLAAVAESAVVTTMVTSEGKSLTEVRLNIRNQAQPFLKVSLPPDVNILSAEVGGERVKPVQAPDGSRVPLLRPGFHPTDTYSVSFVFMHAGTPFSKKGGSDLTLPIMDIPISVLHWEVFLPEQYKVKDFGGNVMAADLVPAAFRPDVMSVSGTGTIMSADGVSIGYLGAGQLGWILSDQGGAVLANARVTVSAPSSGFSMTTNSDQEGRWAVSNVPSGPIQIRAEASGFRTVVRNAAYDSNRPASFNFELGVASAAETVTVMADTVGGPMRSYPEPQEMRKNLPQQASANVVNLQKRVAGVLPVPVEVPRAGTSFSFVRPLVLNEETKVSFSYKSR
jgi:Carboxypeptidase regulatory-like domain